MPHERDWVKEAYSIANGETKHKPKKEHVIAVVKRLSDLEPRFNQLQALMNKAYSAAMDERKKLGLPVPPPPGPST